MKPRELGGHVRNPKIKNIYLWVTLNKFQGDWFLIPKSFARDIVNAAKEDNVEVVRADLDEGELFIGGDDELPEEADLVEPPEDLSEGEGEGEGDAGESEEDADEDLDEDDPDRELDYDEAEETP